MGRAAASRAAAGPTCSSSTSTSWQSSPSPSSASSTSDKRARGACTQGPSPSALIQWAGLIIFSDEIIIKYQVSLDNKNGLYFGVQMSNSWTIDDKVQNQFPKRYPEEVP